LGLRFAPSTNLYFAAMADGPRLNTAQSEGNLSTLSRMTDTRRAKLMDLKKREDLKDALTAKFKGRFGKGGQKDIDEMSVASETIRKEVDRFSKTANVTEANLMRLERRLQGRAQKKIQDDNMSMMSGVSGYSTMSRARSVASMAGNRIVNKGQLP